MQLSSLLSSVVADAVGFAFFLAGEPDESVEAVEQKKDEILVCFPAFRIASAMTAFVDLEEGQHL